MLRVASSIRNDHVITQNLSYDHMRQNRLKYSKEVPGVSLANT